MIESWFRKHIPFKEIGWTEYKEEFTRFVLLKNRWFSLYLHKLNAPIWHPQCHDHPWWFIAFLIWPGYLEMVADKSQHRRWPGSFLYRPAEFTHNVITPYGTSWSLVLVGPKSRDWGLKECKA